MKIKVLFGFFFIISSFRLCFSNQNIVQNYTLPDTIVFAKSVIPLDYLDIKERLYQEFYKIVYDRRGKIFSLLSKNKLLIPKIKKILKANGVNEDFAYIVIAESELNRTALSKVGASGVWQLMERTALQYGLRVDRVCDERRLIDKSTEVAAAFIKDILNYKFINNDACLAVASYNNGPKNVKKMLESQHAKIFWEAISNRETSSFVCRVIIYKEIFQNPEKYDFINIPYKSYGFDNYDNYSLNLNEKKIDISKLCSFIGISFREFFLLNPHIKNISYKKGGFINKYTSVEIRIPQNLEKMLSDSLVTYKYISPSKPKQQLVSTKNEKHKKYFMYTVTEDTLGEIAFKLGKNWQIIAKDNDLEVKRLSSGIKIAYIKKGQKLKIYQ